MKNNLFVILLMYVFFTVNIGIAKEVDYEIVDGKFKCVSERSDRYNDVETFELKDGKLYDKDGRYLKKAKISRDKIDVTYKVRTDYSFKNSRYKIDRKTGEYKLRISKAGVYNSNLVLSKGFCSMLK